MRRFSRSLSDSIAVAEVRTRDSCLSTSALARAAGVQTSTIRFYERRQLLIPEALKPSGYRLYATEAVRRVKFIRSAQALGLSLEEIAELLILSAECASGEPAARQRAEQKLASIGERIERLEAIKAALQAMLRTPGASTDLLELK